MLVLADSLLSEEFDVNMEVELAHSNPWQAQRVGGGRRQELDATSLRMASLPGITRTRTVLKRFGLGCLHVGLFHASFTCEYTDEAQVVNIVCALHLFREYVGGPCFVCPDPFPFIHA